MHQFRKEDIWFKCERLKILSYWRIWTIRNFIWGLIPSGDGGIVSITFEDKKTRIKLRMGLMDQEFTTINIGSDGNQIIEHGSKKLWKLYFTLQDDPFK